MDPVKVKRVADARDYFVKTFVNKFLSHVEAYCDAFLNGTNKPGKWAEFCGSILKGGTSLTEGIDHGISKGSTQVLLNALQQLIEAAGKKANKNNVGKLIPLLNAFTSDPDMAQEELIKGADMLFRSFEEQIMVEDQKGKMYHEKSIGKLAEDAVDRLFSYNRSSDNKAIQAFDCNSVTEGVLNGQSKKYGILRFHSGHTVGNWKTSKMWKRAGVLKIVSGEVKVFPTDKSDPNTYGYRCAFGWETLPMNFVIFDDTKLEYKRLLGDPNTCPISISDFLKPAETPELGEHLLKEIEKEVGKMCVELINMVELVKDISIKTGENNKLIKVVEKRIGETNDTVKVIARKADEMSSKTDEISSKTDELSSKTDEILKEVKSKNELQEKKGLDAPLRSGVIPNVHTYIERRGIMDDITYSLNKELVVLSGFGGIGKSELARKFANNKAKESATTNVIWIDCFPEDKIKKSFHKLARQLSITTIMDNKETKELEIIAGAIYEKLCYNYETFIIFDDAEDLQAIIKLLPSRLLSPGKENKFYTLVTSNSDNWTSERVKTCIIRMTDFSREEAVDFVKKSLTNDSCNEDVYVLCEKLGRNPLALCQAVAYLREEKSTISDYLKELEEDATMLNECADIEGCKPIYQTLELAIKKLKESKMDKAILVIDILSYTPSKNIPVRTISRIADNNERATRDIIKHLKRYSIVRDGEEDGFIAIHALVKLVRKHHIETHETKKYKKKILKKAEKAESDIGDMFIDQALTFLEVAFPSIPPALMYSLLGIRQKRAAT